jgi:hypothetical protein
MSEKNLIVFYQDMKHGWGRDKYIECYTRKKKWVAWLQTVVWKFGGFIGGTSKGSCSMYLGNENVKKNVMLSYPETRK